MRKTTLVAIAAVAALGACAHKAETTDTTPTTSSQPSGPVAGSAEDFRVSVGDRIYFAYDSFDLTPEARGVLTRQAQWLQRYPNVQLMVAGNADERGTREYNLALGARRAAATKDFLASLGVAPSRMQTVSYGKERPLDPRSNEEGWAVNRNAQSQIVSGAVS